MRMLLFSRPMPTIVPSFRARRGLRVAPSNDILIRAPMKIGEACTRSSPPMGLATMAGVPTLNSSGMENEVIGVQTCRFNVLQEHAIGSVNRNERVVSNLFFSWKRRTRGAGKLTEIDGVEGR